MITIKTIETFTYHGVGQDSILHPWKFKNNIVATDGHMLVVVPIDCINDDEVAAFEQKTAAELVPSVARVSVPLPKTTRPLSINYTALIKILKTVTWKTINTDMRVETIECESCGHELGEDSYEVKVKKYIVRSPLEIDGFIIDAKNLLMITQLLKLCPDGWEYYVEYSKRLYDRDVNHRFVFINSNGIKILIMGIRL